MPGFVFHETGLKDSFFIEDFSTKDKRGEFVKSFEKDIFKDAGIDFCLNETFLSVSARNVIRGMHFQMNCPQAKLVSAAAGAVLDVIADLRPTSPTFKKWFSVVLSAENHLGIYVPRGFAHGFMSLADSTVMLYQCDGKYDKRSDTGIRFDDPELGIDWPVEKGPAVCSDRDLQLMSFQEYMKNPMQCK